MEKEYIVNFEVEYCEDNCMQGIFNEETVIDEVRDFLEARYGSRLKWFVISENSVNGVEEIYNSRKTNII